MCICQILITYMQCIRPPSNDKGKDSETFVLLLECPEGKLLNPSFKIALSICVHMVEFDNPYGVGSADPASG